MNVTVIYYINTRDGIRVWRRQKVEVYSSTSALCRREILIHKMILKMTNECCVLSSVQVSLLKFMTPTYVQIVDIRQHLHQGRLQTSIDRRKKGQTEVWILLKCKKSRATTLLTDMQSGIRTGLAQSGFPFACLYNYVDRILRTLTFPTLIVNFTT